MNPGDPPSGPRSPDPDDVDAAFDALVGDLTDLQALGSDALEPPAPEPSTSDLTSRFTARGWRQPEPRAADDSWADEGHFVPPEPPPWRPPSGPRLRAWTAVVASPLLLIVLAFTSLTPPAWLTVLCALGFVGGITYLVATMSSDHDGWDDGAVL